MSKEVLDGDEGLATVEDVKQGNRWNEVGVTGGMTRSCCSLCEDRVSETGTTVGIDLPNMKFIGFPKRRRK